MLATTKVCNVIQYKGSRPPIDTEQLIIQSVANATMVTHPWNLMQCRPQELQTVVVAGTINYSNRRCVTCSHLAQWVFEFCKSLPMSALYFAHQLSAVEYIPDDRMQTLTGAILCIWLA